MPTRLCGSGFLSRLQALDDFMDLLHAAGWSDVRAPQMTDGDYSINRLVSARKRA